jgi:amino acid transporter
MQGQSGQILAKTGLFVGSGPALQTGGPASLVLAYGPISIMLYCTVHALGKLAVVFPISPTAVKEVR